MRQPFFQFIRFIRFYRGKCQGSLYRRNESKIWWVRFQHNGTRVQRSSGKSRKADAVRFLAKAMEGERLRQEQGYLKVRFEVLCERYTELHLPVLKPRTRANYVTHLAAIKAHFGEDRYIDEVRKAHVAEFVGHLKKTGRSLLPSAVIWQPSHHCSPLRSDQVG